MAETMTQQARIRRLQDTLIIAGDGVIAFSAWSLAKTALFLTLTENEQLHQLLGLDDTIPIVFFAIVLGFFLCIDLVVRVFIGMSARSEGRGKKKGPFYLIVAALAAIANAVSALSTALGMAFTLSPIDTVVSTLIDATALAALILVIYCSVHLRSLNKATE